MSKFNQAKLLGAALFASGTGCALTEAWACDAACQASLAADHARNQREQAQHWHQQNMQMIQQGYYSDQPQQQQRRSIVIPAPKPPKGWKPLWGAVALFQGVTGRPEYAAVANRATREDAESAVKAYCEKRSAIGQCSPSSFDLAYVAIFKHPDGNYSYAASNNYGGNAPYQSSCQSARDTARHLGWDPARIGECPIERVQDIANGIFPETKSKGRR
jgi:hypothetical protein